MPSSAIFLIKSGKALEMVKHHISERLRVREQSREIAAKVGCERVFTDRLDGTITGFDFSGRAVPEGFRKPKSRTSASYPKKGSAWADLLRSQVGHASPPSTISEAFCVPLSLGYETGNGKGWRCIGNMLQECGWLYLSESGPYALWIPDVELEVKSDRDQGHTVLEPAASFKMEIPGCRRISQAEWDLMVAKHQVKIEKQKARQPAEK